MPRAMETCGHAGKRRQTLAHRAWVGSVSYPGMDAETILGGGLPQNDPSNGLTRTGESLRKLTGKLLNEQTALLPRLISIRGSTHRYEVRTDDITTIVMFIDDFEEGDSAEVRYSY